MNFIVSFFGRGGLTPGMEDFSERMFELVGLNRDFLEPVPTPAKVELETCKEELSEDEKECPICKDEMGEYVKLECNHKFCKECLEGWFEKNNTCPICRKVY